MRVVIHRVQDGSLMLVCGNEAMRDDLVFNCGAMYVDDPDFKIQLEILVEITSKVNGLSREEVMSDCYFDYSREV